MVFNPNDSGISAPSPRHQWSLMAMHQKIICFAQHVLHIPEDHSCLVHSTEFPLEDSATSRYIFTSCSKPHSPIGHKRSCMHTHSLLIASVKFHIHVLTLHDNHVDLNSLIVHTWGSGQSTIALRVMYIIHLLWCWSTWHHSNCQHEENRLKGQGSLNQT